MPTPAGLKLLCAAAEQKGVPKEQIEEIARAGEAFRSLISTHAGDRGTFDTMIAPYADQSSVISLADRRSAYRINSRIWGVQAETQFKCVIALPGENPILNDAVFLVGYRGLKPLRADAHLMLTQFYVIDDNKNGMVQSEQYVREPIDPKQSSPYGTSLISKYCTDPIEVRRTVTDDAAVYCELVPSGIGNRGAVDYFEGSVVRNIMHRYVNATDSEIKYASHLHIPCKNFVFDYLVHRDSHRNDGSKPKISVFADNTGMMPTMSDHGWLPTGDKVVRLGSGLSVLRTPLFPQYTEMLDEIFGHLKADPDHFEMHRCAMEYPVVPTIAMMRIPLPDAPSVD